MAHEIEHLVDKDVLGNHTISIRGLQNSDESSSPLTSINIMLGNYIPPEPPEKGFLPISDLFIITLIVIFSVAARRDKKL